MAQRKCGSLGREENKRDKLTSKVTKFDEKIFEHFSETLKAIRAQLDIADELCKKGKATEAEYIWRSQVVFLTSALDFYMHELTKLVLCAIYDDPRKPKEYYKTTITLSIESLETAVKEKEDVDCFRKCVNDSFKTVTMVSNGRIADQLSLLGIDYEEVAYNALPQEGGKPAEALKRRLNELYHRRNEIAHQTDRKHTDGQLQSISKKDVTDFMDVVEKLVKTINNEARKKYNQK